MSYMSYDVVLHSHIMQIYAIFVRQILNNHDFWGVLLETSTRLSWRQQRSSCDILRSLAQTTLPRAAPHHWETHWLQYSRAEKSLANVSIAPIFGYTGVPRKIDKETANNIANYHQNGPEWWIVYLVESSFPLVGWWWFEILSKVVHQAKNNANVHNVSMYSPCKRINCRKG